MTEKKCINCANIIEEIKQVKLLGSNNTKNIHIHRCRLGFEIHNIDETSREGNGQFFMEK